MGSAEALPGRETATPLLLIAVWPWVSHTPPKPPTLRTRPGSQQCSSPGEGPFLRGVGGGCSIVRSSPLAFLPLLGNGQAVGLDWGSQGLSSLPGSLNIMTSLPPWYHRRCYKPAYKCQRANSRPGESGGTSGGAHSCAASQAHLLRWGRRHGISDSWWPFGASGPGGTGASASTSGSVGCCHAPSSLPLLALLITTWVKMSC